MNRNAPDEPSRERAQALLALALERVEPPAGEPPDLTEIAAWAEGELRGERAAAVEAFVARDPECYALWRDYLESKEMLAAEVTDTSEASETVRVADGPSRVGLRAKARMLAWWRTLSGPRLLPLGGLAGAAAVALLALTLVPHLLQDPTTRALEEEYTRWEERGWPPPRHWGWRIAGATRGEPGADPRTDPERSAFLAGMAGRVAALAPWPPEIAEQLRELPPRPAPCPAGQASCAERQQALMRLGEWTLLLHAACAQHERTGGETPAAGFWTRQDGFGEDLRTGLAKLDCASAYCTNVLAALADVAPSDPASRCELAEELTGLGFAVRP